MNKLEFLAAKEAIYDMEPDETLILIASEYLSDEIIHIWRHCNTPEDALKFLNALRETAKDRKWAKYSRENNLAGWSKS